MPINNVSDTARWVAVYRAMESDRPDALFRDPFARRLAGPEGQAIVDTLPQGRAMAWAMIVRTAVLDEMILDAVAHKEVDTVVNLAAGLDVRPWRLSLPPELRWFDVDLPAMTEYKAEMMRGETPRCRYEAISADLADAAVRRPLFARLGAGSERTLVVSEGLLIYLEPAQVGALAEDLAAIPSFRWWLIDLAGPMILKYASRSWGKATKAGNASFKFAPAEGTAFFLSHGWREAAFRSTMVDAERLHRTMSGWWLWRLIGRMASPAKREEFRRRSGQVLLERR